MSEGFKDLLGRSEESDSVFVGASYSFLSRERATLLHLSTEGHRALGLEYSDGHESTYSVRRENHVMVIIIDLVLVSKRGSHCGVSFLSGEGSSL